MNLVIFSPSIYRQLVSLVSTLILTGFVLIIMKLCMCFLHGMRFACGLDIIVRLCFYHFFHNVNLVTFHPQYIDSGYLLWAQLLLQVLYRSLWNFAHVFFMVWGCACGLDIIVVCVCVWGGGGVGGGWCAGRKWGSSLSSVYVAF